MAYKGIVIPGDYAFNAASKTVTFSANYTGIALSDIMYITNVVEGIVIYDPSTPTKVGSLTGLVLTLDYNTTSMADSDALQIIVGMNTLAMLVSVGALPLPSGAATAANQLTEIAALTSIASKDFATQTTLAAILAKIIAAPATEAKQNALIALLPAALISGRLDVNVGSRLITTPNKTQNTSILSLQSVSGSSVVISSDVDVSGKLQATLFIRFGRQAAASGIAGANIRVEASYKSSGNNSWVPLAIFTTNFAAVSDEAVSGTVAAGATVITVSSTTGLTAGDLIFINNGTVGNSEWARIKSIVSNTSVTVEDALVNAATGATIYDNAELFICQLDLSSIGRIRVVDDGSQFTQAHAIQVDMITLDSLA